jgi:hypothetical protein
VGEALGLNPDGRYYYAFRDYASGLEYLRAGRELCAEGLYAELGGYEYKAFLDFREIRDDDFGSWGKLCGNLSGRGVASLDEELKQVRHGAVIEGFRLAVGATAGLLAKPAGKGALKKTRSLIEGFYTELNRHTACSGDCQSLADETLREIAAVESPKVFAVRKETAGYASTLGTAADRLLLAAWLVFHGAGKLAVAEDHHLVAASWFGELGLERAFSELVGETPEDTEAFPHGPEEVVPLLRSLLRWQFFFSGWGRETASTRFTLLFADPGAREFLECHIYAEREWFNRERFEILIKWLFTVEVLGLATAKGPEKLVDEIARLRKELHHLQVVAAAAGYRVDRFQEMLQAGFLGAQNR